MKLKVMKKRLDRKRGRVFFIRWVEINIDVNRWQGLFQ